MTTHTTDAALTAGFARLDAVDLRDIDYACYAEETGAWYLVSESEIRDLGQMLLDGVDDAYSLWCATCGTEVRDTDHDLLDRIQDETDTPVTYRCQCGLATGVRCEWTGRRDTLMHVRWVPDSERGSAMASGTYTYGAYAKSLYVSPECAEMLRYEYEDGDRTDREDPYVRVVGSAYED